jgi:Fe-S-cluster containining protein
MEEVRYQKALEVNKASLAKIPSLIPRSVAEKEDRLLQTFQSSSLSKLTMLEILYSEMDNLYRFLYPILDCKKGCSYCCSLDELAITNIEIEYIKKKVKPKSSKLNKSGQECVFLKNGACSIYQYRPYMCRRLVSFCGSSDWCKPGVNLKYEFQLLSFTGFDEAFAYIIQPFEESDVQDIRMSF